MSEGLQIVEETDAIRANVREHYRKAAQGSGCCVGEASRSSPCCGSAASECCSGDGTVAGIGYSKEELAGLPPGANLGLGCGHPTGLADLGPGEIVLDLGSGAGIDCFLASQSVGPAGHVIGVDMTPEMLERARANARTGAYSNVEFRLGEIEHLPVADRSVDVILSNCVINLALDKGQVYREAFRTLRPGGRIAVSDVIATRPIGAAERADPTKWSSCSSGALQTEELRVLLQEAGFERIQIELHLPVEPLSSLEAQSSLGVVPADIRASRPTAS